MNIASRAFAVSLPKPVAAHFFLFRRELSSKIKRRMVAVVFRSNPTSSSSQTNVGCFVFVSFCFIFLFVSFGFNFCLCFILPLKPFFYHLPPWFATYVHSFLGAQAREAIQKNDTGKQRKQTKKCDLSSRRVLLCQQTCRTQRPWFSGGGPFPRINQRPCERGLRIDVGLRCVWTPQNGPFRKRIFLKTYTCARSVRLWSFRVLWWFYPVFSTLKDHNYVSRHKLKYLR